MTSKETYCDAIQQAVCKECPLIDVAEKDWRSAIQKGTTPFDAYIDVGRAILNAYDCLSSDVDYDEGPFDEEFDSLPERTSDELLIAATGTSAVAGRSYSESVGDEAVADLQITTLITSLEIMRAVHQERPVRKQLKSPVFVIKQVYACVEKQAARGCSVEDLYQAAANGFASIIDVELGASTLTTLARHGKVAEVRGMAARIHEVLADAIDRIKPGAGGYVVDFQALPEIACRSYLMWMAEVLESRVLNTDAPRDDDV